LIKRQPYKHYNFTNLMNLSHIPSSPWVYLFKNNKGQILYVGKAKDLAKRVSQYFTPGSVWKQDMLTKAHRVDFIEVTTESEALYLEDNLIKTNNPEYNRLLKWDNSYIYLKITKEDFPQLFLTRMRKNDGCTYIWPKNNTWDLKKLMHYLRQIYKYRSMKSWEFKQGKLSSDVYFWLDKWRSVISKYKDDIIARDEAIRKSGIIIDKSYAEYLAEYKQIVRSISSFFEGNTREIKKKITDDIHEAIKKEHFERCARLRDILNQVDARSEKQHVVLDPNYSGLIVRITPLQNFWVIILVKIFEGKMTDVIREKKSKEERSLNQMKASLEADFGEMNILRHVEWSKAKSQGLTKWMQHLIDWQDSSTIWEWQITLLSKSMKKIKKSAQTQIDILLQKFLDSYIASTTFDTEDNLTQDLLSELQKRYFLTKFPYQIECVDISHLSGSYISGWLSCMREWLLYKPGYRHYKIKLLENNKSNYSNDFLSLQEIIVRRFNLKSSLNKGGRGDQKEIKWSSPTLLAKEGEFPDLFILDWWKWQLNSVLELCQIFPSLKEIMKTTTFISLGKWKARKESAKSAGEQEKIYTIKIGEDWLPSLSGWVLGQAEGLGVRLDTADLLLTKLRDESHRFANKYRTTRMSQQWK